MQVFCQIETACHLVADMSFTTVRGHLVMTDDNPIAPLRILIADDHDMVLEMIEMFLSNLPDFEVETARTLDDALVKIETAGGFDLVLLDLVMPGMDGIGGLPRAISANAGKPVAILTGNPSPRNVNGIIEAGGAGIVLKTTPLRTLANAIRFMAAGEQYLPRELTMGREDWQRAIDTPLTDKEQLVLSYLAEGMANRDIGRAVDIAEPTVKMHVRSICSKLSVQNRTQAVIKARDLGLA